MFLPHRVYPHRFCELKPTRALFFPFATKFSSSLGLCTTSTTQLLQLMWQPCRMFDFTSRARTTSAAERTSTVHNGLALDDFSPQ